MLTWLKTKWALGRLKSPDNRTRAAAVESLTNIGAPAVQPLLALLKRTKGTATKLMASDDPAAVSDPTVNQYLAAHTTLEKIGGRAELARDAATVKAVQEALASLNETR